ncbi:MAG: rhamnan synthesis F family protein [Streptococcaceae bacterium]|nr:rhamnan synthesis F family protein [Streptococcaceae bacterium]
MEKKKRLLVYVHFNAYNELSEHVIYQLRELTPLFDRVVFLSNSSVSADKIEELKKQHLITDFVQRRNSGFDFAAWRDGLQLVGRKEVTTYDSVTLMNDTCYGPLFDMAPHYARFEQEEVDFWGITNHRAYKESETHVFDEHIQSYFKVFSQKVVQSAVFEEFWEGIQAFENVQDVIDNYEIQSTTAFLKAGFHYQTILDTTPLDASKLLHPDFSYFAPDVILREKVPFIKVKALQNVYGGNFTAYILDYIDKKTAYPVAFIIDHLTQTGYPDAAYLQGYKLLKPKALEETQNLRVAIHLHVHYPDLLEDFLAYFETFAFDYSLFLTTNSPEKVKEIEALLEKNHCQAEILQTENVGRDILPLIALKEKLQEFDIIGHFHTKRSLEASFFAGESWRTELMEMLLAPANEIIANFEANEKLGIVIADIPTLFKYNSLINSDDEYRRLSPIMNYAWDHMGMKKNINFSFINVFTASYGTFFWARKDAVRQLFDYAFDEIEKEDMKEPLKRFTILHVLERLLVYISWGNGYDYRISKNKRELPSFVDFQTLNFRREIHARLLPHIVWDKISIIVKNKLHLRKEND